MIKPFVEWSTTINLKNYYSGESSWGTVGTDLNVKFEAMLSKKNNNFILATKLVNYPYYKAVKLNILLISAMIYENGVAFVDKIWNRSTLHDSTINLGIEISFFGNAD